MGLMAVLTNITAVARIIDVFRKIRSVDAG
jgi:hypothetical protein